MCRFLFKYTYRFSLYIHLIIIVVFFLKITKETCFCVFLSFKYNHNNKKKKEIKRLNASRLAAELFVLLLDHEDKWNCSKKLMENLCANSGCCFVFLVARFRKKISTDFKTIIKRATYNQRQSMGIISNIWCFWCASYLNLQHSFICFSESDDDWFIVCSYFICFFFSSYNQKIRKKAQIASPQFITPSFLRFRILRSFFSLFAVVVCGFKCVVSFCMISSIGFLLTIELFQ